MTILRALVLATVLPPTLLPWAPPTAEAAPLFWCGTHRVRAGEHITEVLDRCGEPDFADQRVIQRTHKRKGGWGRHRRSEEQTVEVLVEDWVYDFGVNRYSWYLRFEDNFLSGLSYRWVTW